jgi:hypothetical protein
LEIVLNARRGVFAASALLALCAGAQSLEGAGRISVLPGWRYTPNDTFAASAAATDHPLTRPSPGGLQLTGVFAYAASASIEVAIDLFAGWETLRLEAAEPVTSVTYGALAGFRFYALWDERWAPNIGLGLGPVLVYTSGGPAARTTERVVTGYAAIAGLAYRLDPGLSVSAEARWLLARGALPEVGGVNGGGLWAGVGLTWWFAPDPSRGSAVQ